MNIALKLAKKGLFITTENPCVGCVLVKDNKIIGQGYHQRQGELHAEAIALQQAGVDAKAATAYVTLEPCSHFGKNPPCADALIQAGIKKVVICNPDPNPLVAGAGIEKLKAAGIKVKINKKSTTGAALNRGFLHRMQTGRPYVRLKMAQSLDGRTAMHSGESYWITGKKARQDVQYWRARSQAILTGIETVLTDDCRLTVRAQDLPKKYKNLPHNFDHYQPMRVILDSQLRIKSDAKILRGLGRKVIITASDKQEKISQLQSKGIEIITMPLKQNRIDLPPVLKWLAQQGINELMVETGAKLAGAFIQQQLVNELIIYTAPVIMGSTARPLFAINIEEMADRIRLDNYKFKQLGMDFRVVYRIK
jgi:diaminohydroxyphosphoribosylaminopyrimidine deaminase/5-amino-6-(5-phosphoribosylamino)uracil reductase